MIEQIVMEHLKADGLRVFLEEPEKQPTEYVIIEKTGSSQQNHISAATFAVQSYAASMYNAALLNNRVKRLMSAITERDDITACECNSDYNYTDPDTKRYRYQAVFDLTYYEEE